MSEYIPIRPYEFFVDEGPMPPRIMGKEGEHMTAVDHKTDPSSAIVKKLQAMFHGFHPLFGSEREVEFQRDGGRTYHDVGNIERATPECLGPLQVTCSEIAGQLMVAQAAKAVVGNNKEKIYRRAGGYDNPEGPKSTGFHENLLTPAYEFLEDQQEDARVFGAYLTTRVIWSGSGLLTPKGFGFSQKAHDIWIPQTIDEQPRGFESQLLGIGTYNSRVGSRRKPMLAWSRHGAGPMESHGGADWSRLEVRYADAPHSPWVRQMTMATASLTLRILEHKDMFPNYDWSNLMFSDLSGSVRRIANDPDMKQYFILRSGDEASALEIQTQLATMAHELSQKVELPADEEWAVHEWLDICRDLKGFNFDDEDTLELLRDRLDWAARLGAIRRRNRKIGDLTLNRSNPVAVAVDLAWDRIHPESPAERYWRNPKTQGEFYAKYDADIQALMQGPPNTRARARSRAIHLGYKVPGGQWNQVTPPGDTEKVYLPDPYDPSFS